MIRQYGLTYDAGDASESERTIMETTGIASTVMLIRTEAVLYTIRWMLLSMCIVLNIKEKIYWPGLVWEDKREDYFNVSIRT